MLALVFLPLVSAGAMREGGLSWEGHRAVPPMSIKEYVCHPVVNFCNYFS